MLRTAYEDECITRSQVSIWHKAFKERRESVEGEEKGLPLTTKTSKGVCLSRNNGQLHILHQSPRKTSQTRRPRSSGHHQQLDSTLRQRVQSHDEDCAELFDQKKRSLRFHNLPKALICPIVIFSVPLAQKGPQTSPVRVYRSCISHCDKDFKQHFEKGVPGRISSMVETLEALCRCPRKLL